MPADRAAAESPDLRRRTQKTYGKADVFGISPWPASAQCAVLGRYALKRSGDCNAARPAPYGRCFRKIKARGLPTALLADRRLAAYSSGLRGKRRLPVRRFPSKFCAALVLPRGLRVTVPNSLLPPSHSPIRPALSGRRVAAPRAGARHGLSFLRMRGLRAARPRRRNRCVLYYR